MKFVCPKMKWEYNPADKSKHRVCHCDDPCTTSSCGRMIYIYPEKNLRAYPGVERGSAEWDKTYKVRVNVEKSINHIKDSFCIAGRKTQNEKTLHADLLLAGITQLVTVIVADKIHQHLYLRRLKETSIFYLKAIYMYCATSCTWYNRSLVSKNINMIAYSLFDFDRRSFDITLRSCCGAMLQ